MPDAGIFTVVIGFLREIGQWSVPSLITLVILSPPLVGLAALFFVVRALRSLERTTIEGIAEMRLLVQGMAQKSEASVRMVEDNQKLARNAQAQTDTLIQALRDNTAALSLLAERVAGMRQGSER